MSNSQTDKTTLSESTMDFRFKVVMLGDLGAGKTSLIQRYINNTFKEGQHSTLGVDFYSRKVSFKPLNLRLQLWDTAGQERYRCLVPSYLRNAHCVVLVFDMTTQQSLDGLRSWVDLAQQHIPKNAIMAMAGTKSDLVDKTAVSVERISKIAHQLDAPFALVSSKTGQGIQQLFKIIVDRLRKAQDILPDVETSSISDIKSQKQLSKTTDKPWEIKYIEGRKANLKKHTCCYI